MLPVTKTAMDGVHLSVPHVIMREAVPYVAIPASGKMRALPEFAPPKFDELHRWMGARNVASAMEGFFRYRAFGEDGSVEMEVGTTTLQTEEGDGDVIAATLPAGRYAHAVHTGPYDRLYDAFLMLEGWMGGRGLTPDGIYGPGGARPACQLEIYRVTPMQEKDPRKWETDLLVKLSD
jgi:effector-binding domain-containing protein